jgi:hypothetical protein
MPPDRRSTDPRARRARQAARTILEGLDPEQRARAREVTRIALARIRATARRERAKAVDAAIAARVAEQARARGQPPASGDGEPA